VRQLVSRLRTDGFDPWFDEERLLPGQDWEFEISTAVKQSDAVVVCLSMVSVEKVGYVQKELRRVLDTAEYQPEARIFVIPVRLELCPVPERLSHWQYADLFAENGYERLRESLMASANVPGPSLPERGPTRREEQPVTKRRWRRFFPSAIAAAIVIAAAVVLSTAYLGKHRTGMAVPNGDLQLFTTPGSAVKVDGKAVGIADPSGGLMIHGLRATDHLIRVDRAGFQPKEERVSVIGEMVNSVTLQLQRIEATNGGPVQAPPDFRLVRRLSGQGSDLNGMLFTRPNELLTYGDGAVLWDAQKGRQISPLQTDRRVFCVSPDSRWLALRVLVDAIDTTQVAEAATGRVVRQLTGYATVFTPDSKEVVILGEPGNTRTAEFWNIESGKKGTTWDDSTVGHIRFSPDGRWIVTASVGISVRDRQTGAIARQFPTKNERVQALAFSSDGRWLAAVHGRTIEMWELATGRKGETIIGDEPERTDSTDFTSAAFMPDSRHLVTVNRHKIQVWDTANGSEVRQWPSKSAYQLAISGDGQWLATNGEYLTVWERIRKP
jgi:WD40 repeat protein